LAKAYRYYVRSPDGRVAYGFDAEATASAVAQEFGLGAALVDTLAQAYQPILQVVERIDGAPMLRFAPLGGWGAGRFGLDHDLIEAIKRGRVEIVHAYLAKGASANARDGEGRSALHWAAARGAEDVAQLLTAHGAERDALDGAGRKPADVARARGQTALADWLASA
jgi:hypothetical protein